MYSMIEVGSGPKWHLFNNASPFKGVNGHHPHWPILTLKAHICSLHKWKQVHMFYMWFTLAWMWNHAFTGGHQYPISSIPNLFHQSLLVESYRIHKIAYQFLNWLWPKGQDELCNVLTLLQCDEEFFFTRLCMKSETTHTPSCTCWHSKVWILQGMPQLWEKVMR